MKHLKTYESLWTDKKSEEQLKLSISDILEEVKDYNLVYELSVDLVYDSYTKIDISIHSPLPNGRSGYVASLEYKSFDYKPIANIINHLISYLDENGYKSNKIWYLSEGHTRTIRKQDINKGEHPVMSNLGLLFGTK